MASAHLLTGTLEADVVSALEAAQLPAEQLVVELTETDLVQDLHRAREQLQRIRKRGVSVAIDDFGSSYSSLGQVSQLPVDVLKIDRSLVSQLTGSSPDMVHVAEEMFVAMCSICQHLGMSTVAEGIETREQRDAVVTVGCTYGQGLLLAEPMPGDAVPAFVGQHHRRNLNSE